MADSIIAGCLLLVFVSVVQGGEYCTDHSTDFFDGADTFWCENGCCGSYYDTYCCLDGRTGTIVGIVIGSLVFLGLVISGIVACFCCCRKSRGRSGQVMNPAGQTSVQMSTVQTPYVTQTTTYPVGPYPVGPYPTQMGYPQPGYPQPGVQMPPGPTSPGNPNAGFDPPKYNEVVNQQ